MEHNEFITTAMTNFLSKYWDRRLAESFQSDILGNRGVRHSDTDSWFGRPAYLREFKQLM